MRDMDVTVRVWVRCRQADCWTLQRMLKADGAQVEWRSQARWAAAASENVALALMASGTYDGIRAAVKRFRDRVPDAEVFMDDAEGAAPDDGGFLDDGAQGSG
jgi:hypothetical protein